MGIPFHLNDWDKRCFKLFRNVIKYGDQVFVRDPETYKLLWVDQSKIDKIIVNEGKGKKPEAYFIRDLDLNLQNLNLTTMSQYKMSAPIAFQGGSMPFATDAKYQGVTTAVSTATGGRFTQEVKTTPIDASLWTQSFLCRPSVRNAKFISNAEPNSNVR